MVAQLQKRKKSYLGIVLALSVILLLFVFLVVSNIKIKLERNKIDKQISALENQINGLKQKNQLMEESVAQSSDSDQIEKAAREDLNLKKEGETVVGFIMPENNKQEGGAFWQPSSWGAWLSGLWQSIKSIF